ncbi:dTDP-glucose 4,6-dehydratase [Candidatus Dojkabacteria bacterium]|uniref:dTDP-glucose 4,6-dehydratase n=1 Tax=Candidatus Dojkabacteria bacterium TaxID=2099670 RepID=A0A955RHZ0_9BACT|nr:dTDP-glucose 4,6-dehydratase [Candidatus Dojkabacteria bacterium]
MNLLVTGGAGFIGSNFIHYWIKNHPKDKVINLDKLTYAGNLNSLSSIEANPNYSFVKGDIKDKKLVDELASKVDTVVHFAAETHVDRSILGPEEVIMTNVVGTGVLLEAARKYDLRLHHISTDEVFGSLELDSNERFNEQTPYDPKQPYSAAKAGSDMLVRAYYETYGVKTTISNCSNNYGPYQHPEKLLPKSIINILTGKKIPMMKTSTAVRDWLFVEDHCKAIDLIISNGKLGETYCIGGDSEIPLKEFIEKVCKLMNVEFEDTVEIVPDRKSHDLRYAIDHTKITKELGWKPSVKFEDGLKLTIDWYKENESWWKDLVEDKLY